MRDGNVDCSDANRIVNIPGRIKSYCRLMLGDIVLSLMGSVGRVGIVAEPDCLLNHRVALEQEGGGGELPPNRTRSKESLEPRGT